MSGASAGPLGAAAAVLALGPVGASPAWATVAAPGPGAGTDGGVPGWLLTVLLVVVVVALAVGAVLLARRRAEAADLRRLEALRSSRAAVHADLAGFETAATSAVTRASGLPEDDDELLEQVADTTAEILRRADDVDRSARRLDAEFPWAGSDPADPDPAGARAAAAGPPASDQVRRATLAYEALQRDVVAATATVRGLDVLMDEIERTSRELPGRVERARSSADTLAGDLEQLRARGYGTSDFEHVPEAVGSRLDQASEDAAALRLATAAALVEAAERDIAETRDRIARLDEERAELTAEIEAVGRRTPGIDQQLEGAYRQVAELEQLLAPESTSGLRQRLDDGAEARAAVPRLLSSAASQASPAVQRPERARRDLDEASALCDLVDRAVAEVRQRAVDLREVADDLPVSADRTATRAQRLAERIQRHRDAVGDVPLDPHAIGAQARLLGDEARAPRPHLVDIAVRLDVLRSDLAAAERQVDDLVDAYAARQLALSSAREAVVRAAAAASAGAVTGGGAALVDEADGLVEQAEQEPDHARAAELATRAGDLARRAVVETPGD